MRHIMTSMNWQVSILNDYLMLKVIFGSFLL